MRRDRDGFPLNEMGHRMAEPLEFTEEERQEGWRTSGWEAYWDHGTHADPCRRGDPRIGLRSLNVGTLASLLPGTRVLCIPYPDQEGTVLGPGPAIYQPPRVRVQWDGGTANDWRPEDLSILRPAPKGGHAR